MFVSFLGAFIVNENLLSTQIVNFVSSLSGSIATQKTSIQIVLDVIQFHTMYKNNNQKDNANIV
ncbi:MAG: hypothetical protein LBQ24_05620 [Candidatus Peribacteria bacterium]|jgi:hypothetical protein|nr:hypothetical protein [Candidatus Peribacteria bacterium]